MLTADDVDEVNEVARSTRAGLGEPGTSSPSSSTALHVVLTAQGRPWRHRSHSRSLDGATPGTLAPGGPLQQTSSIQSVSVFQELCTPLHTNKFYLQFKTRFLA